MPRLSVLSAKPFEAVVSAFSEGVGHPDLGAFQSHLGAAQTFAEMESVIHGALAPSGFMEFARYDLGAFLRKESGRETPKIIRFVVGNPLIMKEMVKHVPDAGSYAPVTVLIDKRADGVHLSYDTMVGFLTPYGNEQALSVARDLDAKVERLLRQAAA
jgi:uncharacterized protein (DUF302 family)